MILVTGLLIAEVNPDPTFSWWWDTAQKVGAGATFVLGVVVCFLWKAYLDKDKQLGAEVSYQKDRDKQNLTVMLELTNLVKTMDQRDTKSADETKASTGEVLKAIGELKNLIIQHMAAAQTHSSRSAA